MRERDPFFSHSSSLFLVYIVVFLVGLFVVICPRLLSEQILPSDWTSTFEGVGSSIIAAAFVGGILLFKEWTQKDAINTAFSVSARLDHMIKCRLFEEVERISYAIYPPNSLKDALKESKELYFIGPWGLALLNELDAVPQDKTMVHFCSMSDEAIEGFRELFKWNPDASKKSIKIGGTQTRCPQWKFRTTENFLFISGIAMDTGYCQLSLNIPHSTREEKFHIELKREAGKKLFETYFREFFEKV